METTVCNGLNGYGKGGGGVMRQMTILAKFGP